MEREQIRQLMALVMEKQGKSLPAENDAALREIGFRSLDFSELALRIEDELGQELNFEADTLRSVTSVEDVLNFFDHVTNK